MVKRRSASGNGSPFNTTACNIVKTAVLAPMQSARVSKAARLIAFCFQISFKPNRMSCSIRKTPLIYLLSIHIQNAHQEYVSERLSGAKCSMVFLFQPSGEQGEALVFAPAVSREGLILVSGQK